MYFIWQVGSEVARRAKGLGFELIAYDPYASEAKASALGVRLVTFDEALGTADFFSLHMPLTQDTKARLPLHGVHGYSPSLTASACSPLTHYLENPHTDELCLMRVCAPWTLPKQRVPVSRSVVSGSLVLGTGKAVPWRCRASLVTRPLPR